MNVGETDGTSTPAVETLPPSTCSKQTPERQQQSGKKDPRNKTSLAPRLSDHDTADLSTVDHLRSRQRSSQEHNHGVTGTLCDSSFRREQREPTCFASETLDISDRGSSQHTERSLNRLRSSEVVSVSSSSSLNNHIVQPQLPKQPIRYATVEKAKTPIESGSPSPPLTRSQQSPRGAACNSSFRRAAHSSLGVKSPANTASQAWSKSCDERSRSPANMPHTQRTKKPGTPEPRKEWDSDYAVQLAETTNPVIAPNRSGLMRNISGVRGEGPPRWRTTNSRWLTEGSYPMNKLERCPSKRYSSRASLQRQRAPIERGRTFCTPTASRRNWVSTQLSIGGSSNLKLKAKLFPCVFVVFLGLLLTIAWFVLREKGHTGSEEALLCHTDDCREYAFYLDFHRNLSVEPCNDFYAHVCSSWQPPKGYGQVASTAMAEVTIKWIRSFEEFLDKAANASRVGRKPQAMFKACVADRLTNSADVKRFLRFLSEMKLSWPEQPPALPSALGVLIDLALNWRDTFWLTLRVQAGKRSRKRLLITQGNKDVLLFFAKNHFHVQKQGAYLDYWTMHFKSLYGNETVPLTEKEILESGSLQTTVVNLLLGATKRKPKVPLLVPLSRIGDYTGRLNSSLWLDQLNSHINEDSSFSSEDEAFIEDRYFLESIVQLFAQNEDEVLLRQMSWEFVQTHIVVVDKAPLEVALWGKTHAAPYIPIYCTMYVEDVYRPLLAYLYSASSLTYRDHLLVNVGVKSLMRQVTEKVNSSWLSEPSKAIAKQKYKSMSVKLWSPDLAQEEVERFYRCFPNSGRSFVQIWIEGHECLRRVSSTPFQESSRGMHDVVSSSSVIYDYLSNSVDVAVPIFSRPVYYSYGTRAMFYGGVGFLLASQMMKAQDSTGLYINANGSVVDGSWMAASDSDELQNRIRCLGVGTEDYLVSHVAALEVAYSAFAAEDGLQYSRRQISRNLTEAQVFFLMLCRAMCHAAEPAWDPGTDCNMLLKNSPHFSEAFHCARGSPMNPERKCGYFE
ncbi:hypothetical protein HPB50_025072 [Hyalomma asiaticum]|uniref:Uncharacterized protein n=1 Tax=Hyalomma asiaticum TaxID=266040 RepID=A0ACB7TNQ3_HYAAI|nr:hypothetical protein HPB50_025072 [Hyalomma asiaticum]